MPLKKLTIELGGLCMLVQRRQTNELFVLMPAMKSHPHCPVVRIPGKHIGKSRDRQIPFDSKWVDWFDLAPATDEAQAISWVIDASLLAGESVDQRWLRGTPQGCLAARIRLPLGATKISLKKSAAAAKLRVDRSSTGPIHTIEAYGQAVLDLKVAKPGVEQLEVAGEMVKPCDNAIELTFLNVPGHDLIDPRPRRHCKGDPLDHPQGYFELLEGGCGATARQWPRVFVDVDVPGEAPAGHSPCPKDPVDLDRISTFFIDPYNCTIGGGS